MWCDRWLFFVRSPYGLLKMLAFCLFEVYYSIINNGNRKGNEMSTYEAALAKAVLLSEKSETTFLVVFECSDDRHAADSYRCTCAGAWGAPTESRACGVARGGKVVRRIENQHVRVGGGR